MDNELQTSEHVENQKIEINRLLKSNAYLKKENNKLRSTDKALLLKEMDRVIYEYAKLKEDYNKLVDENKTLTETLDKLRTKKPYNCENKWATLEEAKEFIDSLDPVLSETPSVVINTKSINITFDNHTNNFKEDDTND